MAVLALPLGLALEALVGALLIGAAVALAILGRDVFTRLPWPLYLVAQATYGAIIAGIGSMVRWSSAGANNAAQTLRALVVNPMVVTMHNSWAIGDIAIALHGLRSVVIPYYSVLAQSYAFSLVQQARLDLGARITSTWWQAYSWATGVYAYAHEAFAYAVWRADTQFQQAIAHSDRGTAAALEHADAVGQQATRHADAIERQDVAYTQAVGQAAIGYAYQVGLGALAETARVEREALGYAGQVGRDAAAYTAAVGALVAAAAAARSAALADEITAVRDSPCMRQCDPLGELGSVIAELEDLGVAAALLELGSAAAHDPVAAGAMVRSTLGQLVSDTAATVRQLAGLP